MSTQFTPPRDTPPQEPTLGALVHQLTQEVPELIRSEVRLAQAELSQKGKRLGVGAGMFGAAGVLALVGLGVLAATAVLALALVLDAWLAALIVAVIILAAAGIAAVVGKNEVVSAAPPVPERAVAGVKEDLATVRGDHQPNRGSNQIQERRDG